MLTTVRKLFLIRNCIYGVDIQPIAIQIAKLRFFISLLIDQSFDVKKANKNIDPLPNLETKFVASNTLIGLQKSFSTGNLFDKNYDKIMELKSCFAEIRKQYFDVNLPQEKKKLHEEYLKTRDELISILKKDKGYAVDAPLLVKFDPYNPLNVSPFFDSEWMFGFIGFDVVIGNPPYVEHKKLKGISQGLRSNYETYSGTADLYVYFYENGIRNLRQNGTLVFITSNKFIKTSYGENLRKYFTLFRINEIIDFTDVHVFEALVASCVFSISKDHLQSHKIKIAFANDSLLDFSNVTSFVEQNKFYLSQDRLNENIWQLDNETKLSLKEKIESGSSTMDETKSINIFRGVTTGYNPAFIINVEKRNELIQEDKTNKAIIKPLLQGRNIRKWVYNKTSDYLIFTRKGIDIKEFPSIKKYLSKYKKQLEPGVGRKPGNYNWYEIQDNTAYYPEFEKEKIIWGLTSDKWTFAYDNENNYLPSNGYILSSHKIPIKYLLCLMNSRLMEFYFGYIGILTAGGAFTLKQETVSEFPIKISDETIQVLFSTLVDFILHLKKDNKDSSFFENLIDSMVYELYFPEEIKAADCEVLKHLTNLLDLKEDWDDNEKLKAIEKVYKELSAPSHPVSIAMQKMQEVEEVRIIEGRG